MPYSFDEKVEMSQTGSIKWEHLHKIFGAEDLTPMWVADMDFKGPEPVIEAVKRRAELGIYGYTKPPEYLFESVSRWMENRHGWFVPTEWLSYSPGVVTALSACVRLFTSVGDPVVIQPPVYPPFFKVVEENQRQLVLNPLRWADGKYRMDFDDLREKVKVSGAKMLILCSPHNPVGRVWEREELEELAQICLEHDLMVVSDEIHADLVYKPNRHIPFLSLSAELEERTIVCTAPSKTFNMAGLQASFIIIPNPKFRESFNAYMEKEHLAVINPFAVVAADAAYRHGDKWLDQVLDYLRGNLEFLVDFVEKRIPPLKVILPEGTYLVWIDFRPLGLAPDELQEFLVKKAKVALNAGSTFGEEGKGFMRMNIASPRSILEEALMKIEMAVASIKPA